jgi:hypothetical protein
MERFRFKNDNVVFIIIILILLVFLKAVFYYISLTNFQHVLISNERFEKFRNRLSDILDILLLLISLFVLLLRKNNSIPIVVLAIIFLFKAFLHFFVNYRLYQYTSLNQSNIDNITKIHEKVSFVTNTLLFIITIYMLNIIFINN